MRLSSLIMSILMLIMAVFQVQMMGISGSRPPPLQSNHNPIHIAHEPYLGEQYLYSMQNSVPAGSTGILKAISPDTPNNDHHKPNLNVGQDRSLGQQSPFLDLNQQVKIDPFLALLPQLRNVGNVVGPDFGAGLTLNPDLNDHDKQLFLDVKVRLQQSAILLKILADDMEFGTTPDFSGANENVVLPTDRLKQFFEADLPAGLTADPSRAAPALSVKWQAVVDKMNAILYNVHDIKDKDDSPDLGGGLALNQDLNVEDKQLILDLKQIYTHNWPPHIDGDLPKFAQSERLIQFFNTDLPDSLRDDTDDYINRLNEFFSSKLLPDDRKYPAKNSHSVAQQIGMTANDHVTGHNMATESSDNVISTDCNKTPSLSEI